MQHTCFTLKNGCTDAGRSADPLFHVGFTPGPREPTQGMIRLKVMRPYWYDKVVCSLVRSRRHGRVSCGVSGPEGAVGRLEPAAGWEEPVSVAVARLVHNPLDCSQRTLSLDVHSNAVHFDSRIRDRGAGGHQKASGAAGFGRHPGRGMASVLRNEGTLCFNLHWERS